MISNANVLYAIGTFISVGTWEVLHTILNSNACFQKASLHESLVAVDANVYVVASLL